MTELIIMVGLPGSGKSTFVDDYIIGKGFQEGVYGYHIVSRDDIRLAFGSGFNHLVEPHIGAIARTMVRAYMIRGIDIVVDETNTNISTIKMWTELAQEYGYKIRAMVMTTPLKICKERRETSKGKFPENIIDKMYEQLEALLVDVFFNDTFDKIQFFNAEGEEIQQC